MDLKAVKAGRQVRHPDRDFGLAIPGILHLKGADRLALYVLDHGTARCAIPPRHHLAQRGSTQRNDSHAQYDSQSQTSLAYHHRLPPYVASSPREDSNGVRGPADGTSVSHDTTQKGQTRGWTTAQRLRAALLFPRGLATEIPSALPVSTTREY
ncbi:hypothetical protein [Nonomuraea terrae]|uniref:hypothetical protein n=1 Tax=Nonomuraea terrae TaxID=2530383 RepID=UPI001404FCB1|nr:hypothetical protein [Nonomuraea terrae]